MFFGVRTYLKLAGRFRLEPWSAKPGLVRLASDTHFQTTRLEFLLFSISNKFNVSRPKSNVLGL